jgi:hypothetical protein
MAETCLTCGGPLPAPGRGRPRAYCSPACKRSAEFAVRRAQRHLVAAEAEVRRLRTSIAAGSGWGDYQQKALDHLLAEEIPALEARLRDLLAGGADVTPT